MIMVKILMITCIACVLNIENLNAQSAIVTATLKDSSSADPSNYVFKIQIKNLKFDKYWVQDTSYLQSKSEFSSENDIYPYLEKKEKGKFKAYENFKHRAAVGLREKCQDSCCNCIFLKKGESLEFDMDILNAYRMESGVYRLVVNIGPPLFSCMNCDQLRELHSKFIYFKIR